MLIVVVAPRATAVWGTLAATICSYVACITQHLAFGCSCHNNTLIIADNDSNGRRQIETPPLPPSPTCHNEWQAPQRVDNAARLASTPLCFLPIANGNGKRKLKHKHSLCGNSSCTTEFGAQIWATIKCLPHNDVAVFTAGSSRQHHAASSQQHWGTCSGSNFLSTLIHVAANMQNAFRGSAHCGCGHSADAAPLRLLPPATLCLFLLPQRLMT